MITVALIELVAALNILVVLVMLVMEKHRDVAILMSMGARREQIQRIFVLQGLLIGGVGCSAASASAFRSAHSSPLSLAPSRRAGLRHQLCAV